MSAPGGWSTVLTILAEDCRITLKNCSVAMFNRECMSPTASLIQRSLPH